MAARAGPGNRGPRGRGTSSSIAASIRGPPSGRPGGPLAPASSSSSSAGPSSSHLTSSGVVGHNDPSGRIVAFSSPDDACPNCKTTRFLNPKLKLLVSPCYHKLCTSCIDRIWSLGPAHCPECNTLCRKTQFGNQTFSDLGVEREVDLRKRIARTYSKTQDDFDDLQGYNDYLEEVEQVTFNLINQVDVEATQARIAAYESVNRPAAGRNGDNGVAEGSSAASTLIAQQDAHLIAVRKARQERDKTRELQDLQLKKAEQDATVAAAQADQGDDILQQIADDYKQRRGELEKQREEEDQRESIREAEQKRAFDIALKQQQSGKKAMATTSSKEDAWTVDELYQFDGPRAQLSSGLEVFDITRIQPPKQLGPAVNAVTGTANVPFDPYLEPFLAKLQPTDLEAMRAGGYDVLEGWAWELQVAGGSLRTVSPTKF